MPCSLCEEAAGVDVPSLFKDITAVISPHQQRAGADLRLGPLAGTLASLKRALRYVN